MADSITFEMDTTAMIAALNALGDEAQPFINEASSVSANAIATEARARLHRQLGPNATGLTEAGIVARPAYDGNGYVVVDEREPFPNLPLWIEKGTKQGDPRSHTAAPRPFFYISADLERGAHERRIAEALDQAIAAQGMGD